MLTLQLSEVAPGRPLAVLAIGAHADDIEIGAGGTLLTLDERNELSVRYVVLTGSPDRQFEAQSAAKAFLSRSDFTVETHELPEGRLPAAWAEVKEVLEGVASSFSPDLILAPARADAHQDHRTIAEIVPTVFRDHLYLEYEIPKSDGDLSRPSVYVALSRETAQRKVELLNACFASQRNRAWWDDEVFLGLARLRGVECQSHYAEAFHCRKLMISPGRQGPNSTRGNETTG